MTGIASRVREAAGEIVSGGRRFRCSVAYQVFGEPTRPVVFVLGGISANRRVSDDGEGPGWWANVVGSGRGIDPAEWCVVGIDYLGGSGGSRVWGDPTRIRTLDQAHACRWVARDLGLRRVRAIIGASYGGMVALAFAEAFPELVERLVVIGAAHRPHPMATGLRSLQRRIVRLGLLTRHARDGLVLARGIAMTTYRTAAEFEHRFRPGPLETGGFEVEAYLEHCGSRFADGWSPDAFLRLSESIDHHRVEPERIRTRATLVSFDTDAVAPPWLMRELSEAFGAAVELVELASMYGHDAFLKETDAVCTVVRRGLEVRHA